ncbi:MAG: hypothetical protein NUV46_00110 [Nanoarchaeota archaeon]|nr:hypothetical protein [Nanoarchaeota archaeon]
MDEINQYEEIKEPVKKTLDFLKTCENPEDYLSNGILSLDNFYQTIWLKSLKYNWDKVGISREEMQKINSFVKEDCSKMNYDFLFNINRDFPNYFSNVQNPDFAIKVNQIRKEKNLEIIIF